MLLENVEERSLDKVRIMNESEEELEFQSKWREKNLGNCIAAELWQNVHYDRMYTWLHSHCKAMVE